MNTTVTVSKATRMGNHNPHGAGITAYLKNGGTLDRIATMENTVQHRPRNFTNVGRAMFR